MIIRQATVLDCSDVISLAMEMHGDDHPLVGPLTTEIANTGAQAIVYSITLGHTFIALDKHNRCVGTIGALLQTDWWSNEPYLADKWWYVEPEHRRGGAGTGLMQALCARADELNLPLRSYWIGAVERGEALTRVMRRCGLRQVGCIFIKG